MSRSRPYLLASACVPMLVLLLAACERQQTPAREAGPPGGQRTYPATISELQPGMPVEPSRVRNPYEGNVQAIAQGRRYYHWFNCSGCHFAGGGGMGPAFLDDQWIYGSSSAEIRASILEGRPNGMPGYGGRITSEQAWKLAAYVRSLAGLAPEDIERRPAPEAAPGRGEEDAKEKPEQPAGTRGGGQSGSGQSGEEGQGGQQPQ